MLYCKRFFLGTAVFFLVLLSPYSHAQTTKNEAGTKNAEPTAVLKDATEARVSERERQFARALAKYMKEDYAGSRKVLDSLAHDADGDLIVDSLSGLAYHMAGMSYYQVYDDVNAVPMYQKAISIRDQLYDGPHVHRAHTRYNLANSMHWLGRPDTATVLLRDAIAIYDGMGETDTTNWLRSLKLLGVIAEEANDRELTRSSVVAMTSLLEEYSKPTLIDQHQMYYDAVKHYQYLEDYDKAESFVPIAIASARQLGEYSYVADVISTQGNLYYKRKDMDTARKLFRRAISVLDSVKGDPTSLNIVYGNLAASYQEDGDYDEALRYYRRTMEYPYSEGVPFAEASTMVALADVYAGLGQEDQTLSTYARAMNLVSKSGTTTESGDLSYIEPDSVRSLANAMNIYENRARYLLSVGRTDDALRDLEELFNYQDLARAQFNNDGSRFALSESGWGYYDLGVNLYHQRSLEPDGEEDVWKAFTLSERAKAYSQLAGLQQTQRAADRREQDLRYNIAELERQKVADPSLESAYANQLLRLELHLRSEGPNLDTVDTELNRQEVIDYLAATGRGVVEYHLGRDRSFGFYLDGSDQVKMWTLPGADTLQQLVEDYRAAIVAGAYRDKSLRSATAQADLDARFAAAGAELGRLLFPDDIDFGDRLLIVPDGALHYLPFAALPVAESGGAVDYSQLSYRADGREVTTTLSLRYLLELERQTSPVYERNLLAFAPSYGGEMTAGGLSALRSARSTRRPIAGAQPEAFPGLLPLQHNREEVVAITGAIPNSEAITDTAASLANFIETLGNAAILHVAGHGLVDPVNPSLSFLAFAQEGEAIEDDELLYFNDLQTLPVEADLVVLSACETSLGKIAPGESVLSLGNAFASAGARSTLTSLWKVDDAATEAFMRQFYTSLADGAERSTALYAAQRYLREETAFAHPFYWAGFTLSGRADAIPLGPDWLTIFSWTFGVLALTGVCGWVLWRECF
ncbi:CHAT domain-containing protein [Lewinella sp. 4G2]|uniref:CHAT domain-containing protein n=1 Tax=Lewinella sp. 4G2 TaxID=1803372 RepID=UPI0007B4BBC4|nr:CHAT domain-containing protein [Lewinella sp. 4G2]OAV43743.1 hypothetical protein A3850_004190 [Lewinella sp. 4G2]